MSKSNLLLAQENSKEFRNSLTWSLTVYISKEKVLSFRERYENPVARYYPEQLQWKDKMKSAT